MREVEWKDVLRVLIGLWPRPFGKMTAEEAATWRRVCDPHRPGDCICELRGLAETLKFTPRPCELGARLRKACEASRDDTPANPEVDLTGCKPFAHWVEMHGWTPGSKGPSQDHRNTVSPNEGPKEAMDVGNGLGIPVVFHEKEVVRG